MGQRAVILALAILVTGCSDSNDHPNEPAQPIEFSDSFENGLTDWTIRDLDTEVESVPIDWHIIASDAMASDGTYSAELYVDNLTDAAKIWLERPLDVEPEMTYTATISFDLASSDAGNINTFQILANVLDDSPETHEEVVIGVTEGDFPEGTYNGGIDGYVWLEKSVEKEITAGADGKLYLVLGIWGTFEGPRTYYFDNLAVSLSEVEQ